MTVKGIVRGNTISLERLTGLPEGQAVEVEIRPDPKLPDHTGVAPMDRLRRAFGAWSDGPETLDEMIAEIRRGRDVPSRPTGLEE